MVLWGYTGGSLVPPVEMTNLVTVTARGYHVVAQRGDGQIFDWGGSGLPDGLSNVVGLAAGQRISVYASGIFNQYRFVRRQKLLHFANGTNGHRSDKSLPQGTY